MDDLRSTDHLTLILVHLTVLLPDIMARHRGHLELTAALQTDITDALTVRPGQDS
jgi:hypothetical protein